jgi:hypothetical protein
MALHLARSDRSKGSREEGDDEVMLPIIFFCIIDQPILSRRKGKIECFFSNQLNLFFLGFHIGEGKRE